MPLYINVCWHECMLTLMHVGMYVNDIDACWHVCKLDMYYTGGRDGTHLRKGRTGFDDFVAFIDSSYAFKGLECIQRGPQASRKYVTGDNGDLWQQMQAILLVGKSASNRSK